MSNEITRQAAVRALQHAMESDKAAALITKASVAEIGVIGSFLRKNHRLLRVSSLNLVSTLIGNGLKQCDEVLVELPQLITDQDMHIAQLAMNLAVIALDAGIATNDKITERILALVVSPLLQGTALKTLLLYFNTIVKQHPGKYKETARALTQRIYRLINLRRD